MSDAVEPTQAQVLERIKRTVYVAQRAVELSAVQVRGVFDGVPDNTPEGDAAADAMEALAPGRDGWSVDVRRQWGLQMVPGVLVLVRPGNGLEGTLAQLERIKAELLARPELLDADWSQPLPPPRPALRLVKPR